jgi:hypothetical protein
MVPVQRSALDHWAGVWEKPNDGYWPQERPCSFTEVLRTFHDSPLSQRKENCCFCILLLALNYCCYNVQVWRDDVSCPDWNGTVPCTVHPLLNGSNTRNDVRPEQDRGLWSQNARAFGVFYFILKYGFVVSCTFLCMVRTEIKIGGC